VPTESPHATVIDARVRLPVDLCPGGNSGAHAMRRQQYDAVFNLAERTRGATLRRLLTDLDESGVDHAIVHAETEGGEDADALNNAVAQLVADHPARFSGFGTIDLHPIMPGPAARQVDAVARAGLRGINLQPAFAGIDMSDRRLYPAYARAEELGLIVAVHTGIHYSRMTPMSHERPELLDRVACDFPDMRIIACHAGWPWVAEYCAIARRHPTVHLELGGIAPKYVMRPGSGWDVLAGYLGNLLTHQVLFATDWPVIDHGRVLEEWRVSGIPHAVSERLLGANALGLLRGASNPHLDEESGYGRRLA
jgi:uncharacterized protein